LKEKIKINLVSHTHWDREWYLTFEQFRYRLVRLVDNLLELLRRDKRFKHFMLDGQSIVLEDYLDVRPERREELRRHIRQGRISVGPWYVLPDEYLVSGEALIRNLQYGREVADAMGGTTSAGYLPDSFGHVAQMPQILKGFGIDNFIFSRGMPRAEKIGAEFRWQALDKQSEVLAIWQQNNYTNAMRLGILRQGNKVISFDLDLALQKLQDQAESLLPLNRTGVLLFNNGVDHWEAQQELPDILEAAKKELPQLEIHHTSLEKHIGDISGARDQLKIVQGELRSAAYRLILVGVLSTRMYLKRLNRICELLLERWAEPVASIAAGLGAPDNRAFLRRAWKILLQNHPHDSICGCSVDEVHREMVTRFEKVIQIAETVLREQMSFIESRIHTHRPGAGPALVVWNTLPGPREQGLLGTAELPSDFPRAFRIVDNQGRQVGFQTSTIRMQQGWTVPNMYRNTRQQEIFLDVAAHGIGYQTFWLLPGGKEDNTDSWARRATRQKIETDYYRIRFHANGTFDLFDKSSCHRFRNLHAFEDQEDIGDEYDFSPAPRSQKLTTRDIRARVRIAERGPLFVTYEIICPWRLPAGVDKSKTYRKKQMRSYPIRTLMRVFRSKRRIEMRTEVDNRVQDHRLRVLFPALAQARYSWADGHFGIVRRPVEVKSPRRQGDPEPTTFHMRHFTSVAHKGAGLAVLGRHLTEYEILQRPGGGRTIAITLLRCVGMLSERALPTRHTSAGPILQTPEAQCPGSYVFEYALLPFEGRDPARKVTPEAEAFACPARMTVAESHEGDLPAQRTFLSVDHPQVVFSAWKPCQQGQGSVFRVYNPSKNSRRIKLKTDSDFPLREQCDLKEDPVESSIALSPEKASIRLRGCEIVSLKIG
jgi:alpha-mannosidase